MTEQEIVTLIAQYNATEAAQALTRREIYNAVNARKGYRRIAFIGGAGVWSNCWDLIPSAINNLLNRHDNTITEYSLGEE